MSGEIVRVELDFEGEHVRVAEDRRASVLDILSALGYAKPRDAWARISEEHPEVVQRSGQHQFPGAGQRLTPVLDREGVLLLLMVAKGKKAGAFREWASRVLLREMEAPALPAPVPGPSPEIAELRAQLAALTASVTALVRLTNRAPAPALESRREVGYSRGNQPRHDPRQGSLPADPLSLALALGWERWDAWYAGTIAERLSAALGSRVPASEVWRAAERLGWHAAHSRGAEWRPRGWVYLRSALPALVREILRGGL